MRKADRVDPLARLHAEMRSCRRCLDAGYPITPRAIFSGPQTGRIMVVGQAPGENETETGRPFDGPAGRRLFSWLGQAGFEEGEFRATEYITAITKCYPGKKGSRGDRVPTAAERRLCAPFLIRELALVDPEVIVPVGRIAISRFLGGVKLAEAVGGGFERDGRLIIPLPHPSGANLWLNRPENREILSRAIALLRTVSAAQRAAPPSDGIESAPGGPD